VAIYTGAKALSRWPINDESTLTQQQYWSSRKYLLAKICPSINFEHSGSKGRSDFEYEYFMLRGDGSKVQYRRYSNHHLVSLSERCKPTRTAIWSTSLCGSCCYCLVFQREDQRWWGYPGPLRFDIWPTWEKDRSHAIDPSTLNIFSVQNACRLECKFDNETELKLQSWWTALRFCARFCRQVWQE
jgi:hypothetical protein